MQRAAILIGVSKSGGLPKLQAVESGIKQIQTWAIAQGITGDRLVVLTDKTEKVRAFQIVDAIQTLVQRRDLDQLIVYFTGHGIHSRGDFWLLSDAPVKAAEAVNVEGSLELARYCGINYIVFISDACRTAANGIQALGITGTEIFPNDPVDGMERPVDAFFACARGKPALEVRDPVEAASGFCALYTEVLSECLVGKHVAALDRTHEDGAEVDLVRAWKLADELLAQVPLRLKAKLGKTPSVNQTPVARISSREAWISRVPASTKLASTRGGPVEVLFAGQNQISNAVNAADQMVLAALSDKPNSSSTLLSGVYGAGRSGESIIRSAASDLTATFRPSLQEIRCGFRLRGARAHAVHCVGVKSTVLDNTNNSVISIDLQGPPVSVLLVLEDGGVLIPAIPDFVTELTFEASELIHIAYEPSKIGARWAEYEPRLRGVRSLRGSIAAAARMGVFRLTDTNEIQFARAMKVGKWLDPSIALYAAYAYHEVGRRDRIQDMQECLQLDFGFTFFDIALLASRGYSSITAQHSEAIIPSIPMFSRGWSLLKAFRAQVAPELMELQSHLRPSLWTYFSSTGTIKLLNALKQGKVSI